MPGPSAADADAAAPPAGAAGGALRRLDPRVVRIWRWIGLGITVVAAAGCGVAAAWLGAGTGIAAGAAAGVLVVGVAAAALWPPARYRCWGYRVGEGGVRIRRGVLWRTVSVVPFVRIQHVDTRRGPLARWAGLSSVIIYTAGTRGASIAIPGLDAAAAEALRDELSAPAGLRDAV